MDKGLFGTSFKLLVFTLVTIIVTSWLAAIIGNTRPFSQPYVVTAEFSDATGVLIGDVVKAAGVDVGRVSDIEVDSGRAIVSISLDDGVQIPTDVEAHIKFRNLIGQRMITLVDPSEDGEGGALAPGAVIPLEKTQPAFDLTVLFNGLRPLIRSTDPRDINLVSRAIVEALEGRDDDIASLLTNITTLSELVSSRDQELTALLDNVNVVTEDLSSRDQQLQTTLATMSDFLGDIATQRDQLDSAIVNLDRAAQRLDRVVARNDSNIRAELKDLATLLDAVDDKRQDLRGAVRALPEMLLATERAHSYGQWSMIHLIAVCKDDFGTCGARSGP